MKNLIYQIATIIGTLFLLSSCHSTTKVAISGTPYSEIYDQYGTLLTTLSSDGKGELELNDNKAYSSLLLSKTKDSQEKVPFALDYEHSTHGGARAADILTNIGYYGAAGATIYACTIDVVTGLVTGLPVTGGLLALNTAIGQRRNQYAHEHQYEYLSHASTNQDITFQQPNIQYVSFEVPSNTMNELDTPSTEIPDKTSTKKSKKVRPTKDNAINIEGTYVGSGKMSLNSVDIETMRGLKFVIKRTGKNEVDLSLIETDGNNFFGEPLHFNVNMQDNKTYYLNNGKSKGLTITIGTNGTLQYKNTNLVIDNVKYSLSITATKLK